MLRWVVAVVLIYDINYPDECSGNILFYRAQVSSAHKDDTKLFIIDGPFFVYNPVQASYYIVHPVLNPATEFIYLDNLQPYTSYQLVMRTANLSTVFLHTDTKYFSTSGRVESHS